MHKSGPVEVQVVFDSSRQRGRRTRPVARPSVSRAMLLLGAISLLVSGAMYYAIWWKVDPFIYLSLCLKSPLDVRVPTAETAGGQPDLEDAASVIFRIRPERNSNPGTDSGETTAAAPRWTGSTARNVIGAAAYSWLTLATLGCLALALAAGVQLSSGSAGGMRILGAFLTIGIAAALAYGAFRVWGEFKIGYKPNHLRLGMGGLVLLAAAVGLTIRRGSRPASRVASIALIVAAAGSAVGLYLWGEAGAIEMRYAAPGFLALVFAVHSLFAWILLPLSWRI